MSKSAEHRIEHLEKKLRYLLDRQEILDCIANNARGCDRHDSDLLSGTYHDDGVDEHGAENTIPGKDYHEWANHVHSQGSLQNMHNITTHVCDINGDIAHAESYVIGLFFNSDGNSSRLLAGRYIDKLERRDDKWCIKLRRCTVEVGMTASADFMNSEYFRNMGFLKGMRDSQDVSYQRPLEIFETPVNHRWEMIDD